MGALVARVTPFDGYRHTSDSMLELCFLCCISREAQLGIPCSSSAFSAASAGKPEFGNFSPPPQAAASAAP